MVEDEKGKEVRTYSVVLSAGTDIDQLSDKEEGSKKKREKSFLKIILIDKISILFKPRSFYILLIYLKVYEPR